MATSKAKKKKAANKKMKVTSARRAAKKAKSAPTRTAAKKSRTAPARRAGKGKPALAGKARKRVAGRPAAAVARKASAKKTRAAKVAQTAGKPGVARAQPLQRRDHAGHIDPKYAADLLEMSEPRETDPRGFLERPRSSDDLVEELGEEFVQTATSAEYKAEDALNEEVTEEVGGPFVETGSETEFAQGTDPSNPESATREPFPST